MGQANFYSSEQGAHCCPVSGKVGQIPGDEWAAGDGGLERTDERIAVDGLNDLELQ